MKDQCAAALDRELKLAPPEAAQPWSHQNAHALAHWAERAPSYLTGSSLIHSDLNPFNVLVADRAHVVDWAWWKTGPAWVDAALVVARLIAAGHHPSAAEAWAAQLDGFRDADPDGVTAFAASLLRLWERRFVGTEATDGARQWIAYRLSSN